MSGPVQGGLRLLLVGLLACLLAGCRTGGIIAGISSPDTIPTLNPEGEAELRAIVSASRLPGLGTANFGPERADVADFYARSGYRPGWVQGGEATPQALLVIRLLRESDQKALNPDDYDASLWDERLERLRASPDGPEAARFDAAVTVCLMRYVRALHFGRVNPNPLGPKLDIAGRPYDMAEFLDERVVRASDPKSALALVEPQFAGYRQALGMLRVYKQMAALDDGEPLLVPAQPIAPGKTYAGAPRLARLLRLVGDLPGDALLSAAPDAYDGALVEAVKRFQDRHGQIADGVLDSEVVNALNVPLSRRVRQLEVTLERWRWLPHSSSGPRIVVNLPEFRLHAYDADNQEVMERKIIVGGARGRRSPVFEKTMRHIVFRPHWDVPPSIQRHEIVPHIQKDRDYVAKHHYQVVGRDGEVVTDGSIDDQTLTALRAGRLRVRQKPGTVNALGLVKFVFPNDKNVYMHDTDAPTLFSRERRDLSHGCIRVQGADELAAWVLQKNPGWDLERVREAMNSGRNNVTVRLVQPVSVVIFYGTVAFDQQGKVFFFNDMYGYDAELDRTLARHGQAATATEAKLSSEAAPQR